MGHLEDNFTPILYIGRKVPKGLSSPASNEWFMTYTKTFNHYPKHNTLLYKPVKIKTGNVQ